METFMAIGPPDRIGVLAAALVVGAAAAPLLAVAQPFPGMGGRPPGQEERKIVARFDKDGDKRLDTAERAAARAWLATQPGPGRGGPPGRGGLGFGPGGRPPGPGFGPPPPGGPRGPGGPGRGGPGGERHYAMVTGSKGATVTQGDVKAYPAAAPLYATDTLRTLFLQFENADWETELAAFNNTDVEVPATVAADGRMFANVGVHFRGNSSFMMVPQGSKRSLNLSFDFVDKDQRLLGYKTLNLLNAMNDPTFVRTALYSQIARDYIAAPKVNLVHLVINGENWGVYVNAQQFNKEMLAENFGDVDGARWSVPGTPNARGGLEYLGDDPAAYKTIYEIKTKDDPADWKRFIELTRVLNQTPPDRLEAALEPMLDIDGALKFLALDVVLANSDGYWTRASDYNLYLDKNARFHLVPHDINEALNGHVDLDPLVAVDDATKPLRSKLLAVPALRERYLAYVRQIATTWLDWNKVGPIVEQYRALAGPEVRADTRKLYSSEDFDSSAIELKTWVEQRRAFLLGAA
jgi:hypothetical protein